MEEEKSYESGSTKIDSETRAIKWREVFLIIIGAIFIASGVIFNVWIAGHFFTQDGELSSVGSVIIWGFDMIAITIGVLFIRKRKSIAEKLHFSRTALTAWLIMAVVLFGALEITARVIDNMYDSNFSGEKRRLLSGSIIPFRMFGFKQYTFEDGTRFIQSSKGRKYDFEKPENTIRIVAFGGSTTQQDAPDSEDYPKLLEERLGDALPDKNIEVVNVGNVSYTTAHSIILLTLDVISWDPDVVILSHNINDLIAGYIPDFAPDYSNKFSHPAYTKGQTSGEHIMRTLFGWSTLYWIFEHQFVRISLPAIKEAIGGKAYTRASYGPEPPAEAQDIFRRNLETFVDIAKSHGIKVVLATQPFEPSIEYWDRTMRFHLINDIVVYPLHEELVMHHERFNEIIREVARVKGVSLVDNAKDMNGIAEYFRDHVHYTKEGLEHIADNYANYFIVHKIVR